MYSLLYTLDIQTRYCFC